MNSPTIHFGQNAIKVVSRLMGLISS